MIPSFLQLINSVIAICVGTYVNTVVSFILNKEYLLVLHLSRYLLEYFIKQVQSSTQITKLKYCSVV